MEEDGYRALVDRLWPRGLSKERAHVDLRVKEVGSSTSLRRWSGHDPAKWEEFRRRYLDELREIFRAHPVVTLLDAARDEEHNNAVALRSFLEEGG